MTRPRILITRTRHQSSELATAVEAMGAEAILVPMIEVVTPQSFDDLDAAIRLLDGSAKSFNWVLFTSANAVHALAKRAHELGVELKLSRVAVIGPATGKALEAAGLVPGLGPVLIPAEYSAEALAEALLSECQKMQKFLLVRADEARDVIPEALKAAGHSVFVAAAYRNMTPAGTLSMLREIFSGPETVPDMITFTSSSTARNLVGLLAAIDRKIPNGIALASIGPITSGTLLELGYEPSFEASEPTIASMAAAISRFLSEL